MRRRGRVLHPTNFHCAVLLITFVRDQIEIVKKLAIEAGATAAIMANHWAEAGITPFL